jgi:hypothetical protein
MPRVNRAVGALLGPGLLWRILLPAVLIIFLVPFVLLLFYSTPAADDFCKATLAYATVPQRSVLAVTWLYYTQWTPRWLTTFLQSLIMSHVDLATAYGWLLLSVVIINLASLWYFFRAVFRFSATTSLLVAATFYAAWIASIGSPGEQIYWLTGAMEYGLPLSAMLALLGLLCQARTAVWSYVLIILLSIAIPGQHEIAGAFVCAVLLAGAIVMRLKQLPSRQWQVAFGAAALSYVAVVLSPGTAVRAASEHKQLWDIAHSLRWAAHSFYTGLNWLSAPAILLASCSVVLLSQSDRETDIASQGQSKWLGLASLGAMLLLLCLSVFVEIATATWLPPRVVAWFEFVFWLIFVCVMLTGVPELHQVRFSAATRVGVFSLFAVTLLGSTNFRSAVEDLRGPAQAWHRADVSRLQQRGGSLEFEAPAAFPKLVKPQMLDADPGCWVNRCMANYLNARAVFVRNSRDKCP